MFGHKGRAWLAEQDLPPDEQAAAVALLRQLDFHAEELRFLDIDLGQVALGRPEVLHLMSVPGIDATVAGSIVAAVGEFTRFRTRRSWWPTSGSTPGSASPAANPLGTGGSPKPAQRTPAACWSRRPGRPSQAAGPLRAFYQRVQARRGMGDRCSRHRPQTRRAVLASDRQG